MRFALVLGLVLLFATSQAKADTWFPMIKCYGLTMDVKNPEANGNWDTFQLVIKPVFDATNYIAKRVQSYDQYGFPNGTPEFVTNDTVDELVLRGNPEDRVLRSAFPITRRDPRTMAFSTQDRATKKQVLAFMVKEPWDGMLQLRMYVETFERGIPTGSFAFNGCETR